MEIIFVRPNEVGAKIQKTASEVRKNTKTPSRKGAVNCPASKDGPRIRIMRKVKKFFVSLLQWKWYYFSSRKVDEYKIMKSFMKKIIINKNKLIIFCYICIFNLNKTFQ